MCSPSYYTHSREGAFPHCESSPGSGAEMREHLIAVIPGDGIGPEVIAAGLDVLRCLEQRASNFRLHFREFPYGTQYYKQHSAMMTSVALVHLRSFDAIYFGAVGAPDVPDHITLWGLRL